jgi:hypothetical protein
MDVFTRKNDLFNSKMAEKSAKIGENRLKTGKICAFLLEKNAKLNRK